MRAWRPNKKEQLVKFVKLYVKSNDSFTVLKISFYFGNFGVLLSWEIWTYPQKSTNNHKSSPVFVQTISQVVFPYVAQSDRNPNYLIAEIRCSCTCTKLFGTVTISTSTKNKFIIIITTITITVPKDQLTFCRKIGGKKQPFFFWPLHESPFIKIYTLKAFLHRCLRKSVLKICNKMTG